MIKRKNPSPAHKSKDQAWKPSDDLLNYMKTQYPEKMPVPYLTGITKKYNKQRCLHEEDKFIQKFVTNKGFVSTSKIVDYLKVAPTFKKGQALAEESVKRIFNASARDGKVTADCLAKMASEVGVSLSDKEAVDLVKRYGRRKQHLSLQDCLRLNGRKTSTSNISSKSLKKGGK